MLMNQLIHQESGTSNLNQFTSNPIPIFPKSVQYFGCIERINMNAVDNGDVEVSPSGYPFETTSEYIPDP